jgi:hypothetical protein
MTQLCDFNDDEIREILGLTSAHVALKDCPTCHGDGFYIIRGSQGGGGYYGEPDEPARCDCVEEEFSNQSLGKISGSVQVWVFDNGEWVEIDPPF